MLIYPSITYSYIMYIYLLSIYLSIYVCVCVCVCVCVYEPLGSLWRNYRQQHDSDRRARTQRRRPDMTH